MSQQLNFLFQQALLFIQGNNLNGAELLLNQIVKKKPNHSEALRYLAFIFSLRGHSETALEFINKAIVADKKNGIAYSNRGNILLSLGMVTEAIESYMRAIKLSPEYAEAYGNLANTQQDLLDYDSAILNYKNALQRDPGNPDFYCNLGNCLGVMGWYEEAKNAYRHAIELQPNHYDSKYFLGQLELFGFNFLSGWIGNEHRWRSRAFESIQLKTSNEQWRGQVLSGALYITAEQGIGDQILYASMLQEMKKFASSIIVSADTKLLTILRNSFPGFQFIDKAEKLDESKYEAHIPIGSIGQFLRGSIKDFRTTPQDYLLPNKLLVNSLKNSHLSAKKILCGVSWKSSNKTFGAKKSMKLEELLPIFELNQKFEFINLQHDYRAEEIKLADISGLSRITSIPDLDLFEDIEGLLALIAACDIVVTTSNSTAHFAGAMGKEVLLLLPFSGGRLWYWHDIDGFSLWYPSIKVFKQDKQGDWSKPVQDLKAYLENGFGL